MVAYSEKAQPFLDAIADGVFTSKDVRRWLLKGTWAEMPYADSEPLIDEQRSVRWAKRQTTQPFWANYWCGKDSACTCRIEGSRGLESDAIFFLKRADDRTLAVHIEFKHPNEAFGFGQPEAYPLRAECFSKTHTVRSGLNAHDDWTTVLFCGSETLSDPRKHCFHRVITHEDAAQHLEAWPR